MARCAHLTLRLSVARTNLTTMNGMMRLRLVGVDVGIEFFAVADGVWVEIDVARMADDIAAATVAG